LFQDLGFLFLFAQKSTGNAGNYSTCNLNHESEEVTYRPFEVENIIKKLNVKRLNIDFGIKMLVANTFEPEC